MSRFTFAALLAVALSAAGCSNDTPTTPTTTTPATTVSDTFSGTLTRNGASSFAFNVSAAGAVFATLTSVSDTSVPVSLSLGVWNTTTSTCGVQFANDAAVQGATVTAQASGIGQLCIRVADPGSTVADPIDYQVTVVHF